MNVGKNILSFRARRMLFWCVVIGGFFLAFPIPQTIVELVYPRASQKDKNCVFFVSAGAYLPAFVAVSLWFLTWRCQKCGRRFHWGPYYASIFNSKCLNCGVAANDE